MMISRAHYRKNIHAPTITTSAAALSAMMPTPIMATFTSSWSVLLMVMGLLTSTA